MVLHVGKASRVFLLWFGDFFCRTSALGPYSLSANIFGYFHRITCSVQCTQVVEQSQVYWHSDGVNTQKVQNCQLQLPQIELILLKPLSTLRACNVDGSGHHGGEWVSIQLPIPKGLRSPERFSCCQETIFLDRNDQCFYLTCYFFFSAFLLWIVASVFCVFYRIYTWSLFSSTFLHMCTFWNSSLYTGHLGETCYSVVKVLLLGTYIFHIRGFRFAFLQISSYW